MFKPIADFIQEKISKDIKSEIDDQQILHLASTVLLLEVSRADFDIQEEELVEITKSLAERFNFSDEVAKKLITLAKTEQDSHASIYPFVKIINDSCSVEEKKELLEDLWRVAYADNQLDKYEEYQIRKIAELLYMPHSVFIQTKLNVIEA